MKPFLTFLLFFPLLLLGQDVLDYKNSPLMHWSQINNIKSLTTEYQDDFMSNGRFKSYVTEKLTFNDTCEKVNQFRLFRTSIDTAEYPEIQVLIKDKKPDTSYVDYNGLIIEEYSTNKGRYIRAYLLDIKRRKICEKIWPSGLKPIYTTILEKDIQFNEEGKIEQFQTHSFFGRDDWEFYFDTLQFIRFTYDLESFSTYSWKNETVWDYDASNPTRKICIERNSELIIDTISLSDSELSNSILKSFLQMKDIGDVNKIIHRQYDPAYQYNYGFSSYFEFYNPESGKRIYSAPPYTQHVCFLNYTFFGYQEIEQRKYGKRLYNYLISDTTSILVEMIDLDHNNRILSYYHLPLDYINSTYEVNSRMTNRPFPWDKKSFKYINNHPFLIEFYMQKTQSQKMKNPERIWFKKTGFINIYEGWLVSSMTIIDEAKFELKIKNKMYLIYLEQKATNNM